MGKPPIFNVRAGAISGQGRSHFDQPGGAVGLDRFGAVSQWRNGFSGSEDSSRKSKLTLDNGGSFCVYSLHCCKLLWRTVTVRPLPENLPDPRGISEPDFRNLSSTKRFRTASPSTPFV
jgi:hypothetical protein